MCGFIGIISNSLEASTRETIARQMLPFVEQRGPDEQRIVHYEQGCFGFARLSIRALNNGSQPFVHGKRGTLSMTNGEIYNDRYLRHRYKHSEWTTESDCEAVHAIYDTGMSTQEAVNISGMFATSIYDTKQKKVRLIRDRTGQKPLFYCLIENHTLLFASSIQAIAASRQHVISLNQHEVAYYLFNEYSPIGTTGLHGIHAVKPGEIVDWNQGDYQVEKKNYWSWNLAKCEYESKPTYGPIKEKLVSHLKQSIQQELISDVPIGIFLSGGIDSSLLLALASQNSTGKLKTFSVGFEEADLDESNQAQSLADYYQTDHKTILFKDYDHDALISRALNDLDIPLGDSSYIPSYLLCEVASQDVRCVLGGDGGDELFGGYPTYNAHKMLQLYESLLPQVLRGFILTRLSKRLPKSSSNINTKMKVDRFLAGRSMPLVQRHLTWMSTTYDTDLIVSLIGSDASVNSDLFGDIEAMLSSSNIKDMVNAAQFIDFVTYLPGSIHAKMDCASMSNGLEVRSPFVNQTILESATSIISNYRVGLRGSKIILRDLAKELLPSAVWKRPKRGFNFPVTKMLQTTLKDRALASIQSLDTVIDVKALEQIFEQFCDGQGDHRKLLWSAFAFAEWHQNIQHAFTGDRKRPSKAVAEVIHP